MKRFLIVQACLVSILVAGTSRPADEIVVGSLNIEWFGDAIKPRTGEQLRRLALK